jgi:uncharacterized membrane protein
MALTMGMIRYYRHQKDILQHLYASMFTLMILSILFLLVTGENMMFLIPLCISTLTLTLWKVTSSSLFPFVGIFLLLIHSFSFIYIIAMALTIGALGLPLFLAFFSLTVIIPWAMDIPTDKASNRTFAP